MVRVAISRLNLRDTKKLVQTSPYSNAAEPGVGTVGQMLVAIPSNESCAKSVSSRNFYGDYLEHVNMMQFGDL